MFEMPDIPQENSSQDAPPVNALPPAGVPLSIPAVPSLSSEDIENKCTVAYDEGFLAGKAATQTELRNSLEAAHGGKIVEFTSKIETLNSEIAANLAKIKEMENLLASEKINVSRLNAKLAKLTPGLAAPEVDDTPATAKEAFFRAVQRIESEGVPKDEAMIRVQREKPQLHRDMLAECRK
jgi:hypothetical protein